MQVGQRGLEPVDPLSRLDLVAADDEEAQISVPDEQVEDVFEQEGGLARSRRHPHRRDGVALDMFEPRPLMLRRLMPEVALTEGHEVRELATSSRRKSPAARAHAVARSESDRSHRWSWRGDCRRSVQPQTGWGPQLPVSSALMRALRRRRDSAFVILV